MASVRSLVVGLFLAVSILTPAAALAQFTFKPTCTLSASSTVVPLGSSVTIRWTSAYASAGTISNIGSVGPSGSANVVPAGSATTYVGTFTGPGGTGTCSVKVSTVTGGGPNTGGSGGTGTTGGTGTGTTGAGTSGTGTGTTGGAGTGTGTTNPQTQTPPPSTGGTLPGPTPVVPPAEVPGPTPQTTDPNILNPQFPTSPSISDTVNTQTGEGIVHCGLNPGRFGYDKYYLNASDCGLCDFFILIQRVINWLIGITIPIAIGMFAYAGVLYFTSAGNPKGVDKAKKIFGNVLIGFFLTLAAWLIVQTLLNAIVRQNFFGPGWSFTSLQCVTDENRLRDRNISDLFTGQRTPNGSGANTGGVTPTTNPNGRPLNIGNGHCAPDTQAFGTLATQMSCICAGESGGRLNSPSGPDRTQDGQAFSVGLFQINLTQNNNAGNLNTGTCYGAAQNDLNANRNLYDSGYQLPSGNLNCSQSFNGTNRNARVVNPNLYRACVVAASNPDCNKSAAQILINTPRGLNNWSVWTNGLQNTCRQ